MITFINNVHVHSGKKFVMYKLELTRLNDFMKHITHWCIHACILVSFVLQIHISWTVGSEKQMSTITHTHAILSPWKKTAFCDGCFPVWRVISSTHGLLDRFCSSKCKFINTMFWNSRIILIIKSDKYAKGNIDAFWDSALESMNTWV